jgi:peptidoglycan/xylan/chitin deacetylase (PgdA/CDA1 family)
VRIPGSHRLLLLARCGVQRIAPGALILLYHRIADVERDPWSLCVSPRRFAEHLEVLGDRVRPLAHLAGSRRSAPGCVALTFDDGYADALTEAKPLLERHGAPATVFVTTGGVDGGVSFWWDRLVALLGPPRVLPASLELRVRGRVHRFDLGAEKSSGGRARAGAGFDGWSAARARVHEELHGLLGSLTAAERSEQLAALEEWSGGRGPTPDGRPLRRDEIARLASDGLVEIGAHSVSHPLLPALRPDEREREIRESQAFLAGVLGHRVTSFAYPHGGHDGGTRRIVAKSGFERACTGRSGTVRSRSHPLELPRVGIPDCDGDVFARKLRRFGF